jgi:hypothetical protein
VRGPIRFAAERRPNGCQMTIRVPESCGAELLLPRGQSAALPKLSPDHPLGLRRFQLLSGKDNVFTISRAN